MKHKRLTNLIEECNQTVADKIYDEGGNFVSATVLTPDGHLIINLWSGRSIGGPLKEVQVYHDNDSDNPCYNLAEAIENGLKDFDDYPQEPAYDEWNEHGFADARDYYKYRYGR